MLTSSLLILSAALGVLADTTAHALNLLQGSDATVFPMLAQALSIDASIERFFVLIQKLLQVVAVCLIVYSAWCLQDGRLRDGLVAIAAALVMALAVPITRGLFGL